MKEFSLYIFIVLGIILGILGIIFGAYMPIVKANLYISGLKDTGNVHSVQQFEDLFRPALDYPSPIGQEEVVKYLASDIIGVVNQNNSEDVDRAVLTFIEPYMFKDNVRHLLALGEGYNILWEKFHKESDYKTAESYYLQGYAIGPKLPPILYSLLQLYRSHGDQAGVNRIGKIILQNWNDPGVKALVK